MIIDNFPSQVLLFYFSAFLLALTFLTILVDCPFVNFRCQKASSSTCQSASALALLTLQPTVMKKLWEIPQRRRYQGFISWPFAYYFQVFSQINLYILKRYGYPDILNLATLNNKMQIYKFLRLNKNDMM